MSRLSFLKGHELAIQTVSQELNYLKRYLTSGGLDCKTAAMKISAIKQALSDWHSFELVRTVADTRRSTLVKCRGAFRTIFQRNF
jgi:hypothetical protein